MCDFSYEHEILKITYCRTSITLWGKCELFMHLWWCCHAWIGTWQASFCLGVLPPTVTTYFSICTISSLPRTNYLCVTCNYRTAPVAPLPKSLEIQFAHSDKVISWFCFLYESLKLSWMSSIVNRESVSNPKSTSSPDSLIVLLVSRVFTFYETWCFLYLLSKHRYANTG